MTAFTFRYRDLRRQRVTDALAALENAPNADLAARLTAEQSVLAAGDWRVSDRTYLAAAADWLWVTTLTTAIMVRADPVLQALGADSALSDAQAAAVEALPRGPGPAPDSFLDAVRQALGQDEAAITELVHTGQRVLVLGAGAAYPFDDVGVLLPLRLETVFDPPADGQTRWKLSLRVVPDEASICRDNPRVSADELASLTAFWNLAAQPAGAPADWLESDQGKAAWAGLCAQVAPSRAARLVQICDLQVDAGGVTVSVPNVAADVPNRVGGMPPRLDVWLHTDTAINGEQRHRVGSLPMDPDAQINAADLELPLPADIDSARQSWWASWERAKAVGLGGEWLLPEGIDTQNISALYVVGIGDETPDEHFRAQIDAGEMGMLRLGAPTNSVHGAAAADLAKAPDEWRKVASARLRERTNPAERQQAQAAILIARQLTGDAAALTFFPGADSPDDTQLSRLMAQALWPALWGHWLRDVWQGGDDAHRVGLWAMSNLHPEGALMPIRIAEQPYGLLPVTALTGWTVGTATTNEPRQGEIESRTAAALAALRQNMAEIARGKGNVVGQDTRRLIEMIGRDALSRRYMTRDFMPAEAAADAYRLAGNQRDEFVGRARRLYERSMERMQREPAAFYLAGAYPRPGRLPLVQPWRMTYRATPGHDNPERFPLVSLLERLLADALLENLFHNMDQQDRQLYVLPNSLLIRLLVHSVELHMQWLHGAPAIDPAQRILRRHEETALRLAKELDREEWWADGKHPVSGARLFLLKMPDETRTQWERALRATLDTAAHRIDPWVSGFAWQRLTQHSTSPRHAHRLGVYGWLDGPFIGKPGPTEAGRLHAPSHAQALASLVLRDKYLSSGRELAGPGARNPWQMDIDSQKTRVAEEIADEVRLGFNIHEITGRRIENIIGNHQKVKALRTSDRYAMRPERKDPNEVCDGIRALRGLLAGDPEAILTDAELRLDQPALPAGDPQFPLTDDQRMQLKLLHLSLDTYGDLLMADGALQIVNRQMERAAESMDAAAGFSRPPAFEFIRTPPSGYQLETRVLTTLPFVPARDVAVDASPYRLAEPSLMAFIDNRLGNQWQWTAVNADNHDAIVGTIGLGELGLEVSEAMALSYELLNEAARIKLNLPLVYISEGRNRQWNALGPLGDVIASGSLVSMGLLPEGLDALDANARRQLICGKLGVPPDSPIQESPVAEPRMWIAKDEHGGLLGMLRVSDIGMPPEEVAKLDDAALQARVRAALGLFNVRIVSPKEHRLARLIAASLGSRPAAGRDLAADAAVHKATDLSVRTELSERYTKLYQACEAAIAQLVDAAADDVARAKAVRRALGWGITPISDPHDRDALLATWLGVIPPQDATEPGVLAQHAADALQARLKRSPAPDELPGAIDAIARAIASLASPDGKLSVLACWQKDDLLAGTDLRTQQTEAALDEQWLTLAAPVRPPLARFEALQLEASVLGAFEPFVAWTSSPGDPWRTGPDAAVKRNSDQRAKASPRAYDLTAFVAAYGSADSWAGTQVAVGLLDSFSEAVPMSQRTTTVAFGFNAPASRAPQAILLAVPPVPRRRLDNDLLLQTIHETRELTHARAVRTEDLGELQTLMPSMWLQTSGPAPAHLEWWPVFE